MTRAPIDLQKLTKLHLRFPVYKVKHEYMSEPETGSDRPRKMAQLGRRQYDGIGPVTNDGMPIILRSVKEAPLAGAQRGVLNSKWDELIRVLFLILIHMQEVKEPHQHEWYKRLYQTIHKQKNGGKCHSLFPWSEAFKYPSIPHHTPFPSQLIPTPRKCPFPNPSNASAWSDLRLIVSVSLKKNSRFSLPHSLSPQDDFVIRYKCPRGDSLFFDL